MAATWKYDVISKTQLCQLMHINLKNNPAKFYPYLIWNDVDLRFYQCNPNKNNKMSSNMGSVFPKTTKSLSIYNLNL